MSGPLEVAPVTRLIDQARVNRYAEAARDPNPIHRETPEAAASQFGRPIAHGMLVLALVSEMMSNAYGLRWAESGTVKVRWRAPALPPVEVTARAELRKTVDGVATYDIACETAGGEPLLSGVATARYA